MMLVGLMAQEPVELITYNIRMNNPGDGEHAWPHRKADVINLLEVSPGRYLLRAGGPARPDGRSG